MAAGFKRVRATDEEREEWHRREERKYGRRFTGTPYREECEECGKRIWNSGVGIGAHRRACPMPRWRAKYACQVAAGVWGDFGLRN